MQARGFFHKLEPLAVVTTKVAPKKESILLMQEHDVMKGLEVALPDVEIAAVALAFPPGTIRAEAGDSLAGAGVGSDLDRPLCSGKTLRQAPGQQQGTRLLWET